jgi:hypothetical protein
MGDWRVLLSWNESPQGFHEECGRKGDSVQAIQDFCCYVVVEQHQQHKGPAVPEFTISVKWQAGDLHEYLVNGKVSQARGWRYIMRWDDPTEGKVRHISGYGFNTEGAARETAEAKATKIVKAQQPETVYKFTPEV